MEFMSPQLTYAQQITTPQYRVPSRGAPYADQSMPSAATEAAKDIQIDEPAVAGKFSSFMGGPGMDIAKISLGVFNALEQRKMNAFMRDYYGEQLRQGRADFANNAKSTNTALESRARVSASMRGHEIGSTQNKEAINSFMEGNRVRETY